MRNGEARRSGLRIKVVKEEKKCFNIQRIGELGSAEQSGRINASNPEVPGSNLLSVGNSPTLAEGPSADPHKDAAQTIKKLELEDMRITVDIFAVFVFNNY